MKTSLTLIAIVFSGCLAQAAPAVGPAFSSNPYIVSLERLRAPELPARAARIVAEEEETARLETTRQVVLAAYRVNRASLLPVVGAIARTTPSVAPVAAATAASQQPQMARYAARAAAAAAPGEVTRIVEAVGREVPAAAPDVAISAGTVVPQGDRAAIEGFRKVSPDWELALDEAQRDLPAADQTVSKVVVRAKWLIAHGQSRSDVAGPVGPMSDPVAKKGPPFQPLTRTPTVIEPNGDSAVPPDWERDYSRP